jgi:phospholipid-binding lipoprotein MlaA
MSVAPHRPNWTVWIGLLVLVAMPVYADVGPVIEPAIPFSVAMGPPQPQAVEDDDYDALFDEEFDFGAEHSPNDPFEDTNRVFLRFNRRLDRHLLRPLTRSYQYVVPGVARRGVRRMFTNFNSPSTLVNDLLQLRFTDAGKTLGRFLLNTTLGVGGIFDVGIEAGWEHHNSDFGQTLARLGVGSGPYLVLPILGPNTVRDGFGGLVDLFFQPLTYLIGPTPNVWIGTGDGFTRLEASGRSIRALEESSVDYYAALRSAYLQSRAAHVRHPADPLGTDYDDLSATLPEASSSIR